MPGDVVVTRYSHGHGEEGVSSVRLEYAVKSRRVAKWFRMPTALLKSLMSYSREGEDDNGDRVEKRRLRDADQSQ